MGRLACLPIVALVVGCAGGTMPTSSLASSEAAIRSARDAGATNDPRAAAHLRLAENERARAELLMREGKFDAAAGLLLRAEADAELALALAQSAQMRAEAQKAIEQLNDLKKKMGGTS